MLSEKHESAGVAQATTQEASVLDAAIGVTEKKRSLFDISRDYSEIEILLESLEGEASPEHVAMIDDYFNNLDKERDKKLENCAGLIKEWEALGKARVEEGERIRNLGEVELNRAKYLKLRILNFMEFHKITETIKTPRFNIRAQNNGGVAPLIIGESYLENPELLPEPFVRKVPMANTQLIRETLADPNDPNRELLDGIAKIGDRGRHLRIS